MKTLVTVTLLFALSGFAQQKTKPLTLASQGSFFVGGEKKALTNTKAPGEITVNQMYVQYQIPLRGAQHLPVVMVHGCCLSSKTWETTPDGRITFLTVECLCACEQAPMMQVDDRYEGLLTPEKVDRILEGLS